MGSSKRVDSNRSGRSGRRARHASPRRAGVRASNVPPVKPDVGEIMRRLSDAISVVATAANALLGAQEREGSTTGAEVGTRSRRSFMAFAACVERTTRWMLRSGRSACEQRQTASDFLATALDNCRKSRPRRRDVRRLFHDAGHRSFFFFAP